MRREPTEIEKLSQRRIIQIIEQFCGGSQQTFADKVKIGKSSVSQYVNGTNFPTNLRAAQIAKCFGVSPMWIMGFDYPMYEDTTNEPNDDTFSKSERDLIRKYRALDKRGKQAVIDTINRELHYMDV